MPTGVIYARYSSDKQTENSILGQVRECTEFAKRQGIDIINVYKDEAISGRTATKRPSFMRMIRDASMHLFDYVIVWKGDRFSRSRADAAKFKNELKRNNIRVLSATEANVTGSQAILMDGVNEAFAEYFSVELAEKVIRGMTQNALDGRYNGGPVPFGYKKEGNKIVIDDERANVVREIFKLYSEDTYSLAEIYRKFSNAGLLRDIHGKDLKRSSLFRIIRNTKYYGYYNYRGTVNLTIFPPIITEETFKKAQSKAKTYFNKGGLKKARTVYLLSNKLICAECNEPMWALSAKVNAKGKTFFYYACPNTRKKTCNCKIDKDAIEKLVMATIKEFINNSPLRKRFEDDLIKYVMSKTSEVGEQIKKRLKEIEKKMANMIKAIQQGLNIEILAPEMNKLNEEKKKLELELAKEEVKTKTFTPEHIRYFFKNININEALDETSKKLLIDKLIKGVYIRKDKKITILFKYGIPIETGEINRDQVRMTSREVHQLGNIGLIQYQSFFIELYTNCRQLT